MSDEDKKTEEVIEEENFDDDNVQGLIDKLKKIKAQLKQCQKEKQEYLTGWQRAQADFINFRRRQEEQMGEWLKMSNERVISDILPVLDTLYSFERTHIGHDEKTEKKHLADGLMGVRKQLADILNKNGIEEIKSVGEKFNPEFHEAVEQVKSGKEEGMIVEEAQKGYLLNGRVIRPAKVKVSRNL